MWTHEESIEVSATPAQIWTLFADVPGWKVWNAGIEHIELHGPFANGTRFSMQPPGEEAFTSVLVDVRENERFTDETVVDGARVLVRHVITALPSGNSRVTYSTEITGPAAAEFGPMVTADFPDVLQGLKRVAEISRRQDQQGRANMPQKIHATIETERLVLDVLCPDDAANLFEYRGDAEVARYQGWQPANVDEAAAFIAKQSEQTFGEPDSWCQLAIRNRQTGELVGDFGVHFPATKDDPIEFGLSLKPAHQGKGYAREVMSAGVDLAFGTWGYRRLVGSVDPRNTASVALCRSLGFRQEAHHVESYRFRGEWVDDVIFALLAREWKVGAHRQRK